MNERADLVKASERYHNIDGMRFFLSLTIVYFHILHSNIMDYVGGSEIYTILQRNSNRAGFIVECFTILGGFFLYQSFARKRSRTFLWEVGNRFIRLWPAYLVSLLGECILLKTFPQDFLSDLFLLRATGLSLQSNGIIWYVGPFFWCSILLYAMLKFIDEPKCNIIVAVLVYFGYAININYLGDGGFGREFVYGFISLGMARIFAGLGTGCLIGAWYNHRSAKSLTYFSKKIQTMIRIFCTMAELALSVLLGILFFTNKISSASGMSIVLVFATLFILLLTKYGCIYNLLNLRFFSILGSFSYSLYVMQQPTFYILQRTLWKNAEFVQESPFLCILVSVACCAVTGFLVYFFIERPLVHLYRRIWHD